MRHFAARAALALAILVAAAGCGNRGGSIAGYAPEGLANRAFLSVQVDSSGAALGASALVFMQVPANRVRIYDDVNGKGYQPAGDFVLQPERTYSSNWSVFRAPLPLYDPAASHVLLARGSRDGVENVLSPLSNVATIPAGDATTLIALRDTIPVAPRAPTVNPDASPSIKADSLYFRIGAVSAAQRIFLEVVKSRVTVYLAIFDRQPDDSFARTIVFENVPPVIGQTYTWHVDEYDAQSRRIAATTVDGSFVYFPPKVAGAPSEWPSTSDRFLFLPWTIPGMASPPRAAR